MQTLPKDVHLGMDVYDRNHHHIGKVDDLKFPENEDFPEVIPAGIDGSDMKEPDNSLLDRAAEAFRSKELPQSLRERLLREGYIRIEADGIFIPDRYVLPSQIASADADEIMLNVGRDELIKQP
jgi:hypothetical protein